jgi:rare lipoprotein A (peptidoglycan hydrolase)
VTLAAVNLDSRGSIALPATAPDARALDTLARVPEPSQAARAEGAARTKAAARAVAAARVGVPAPTATAPRTVVRAARRPAGLWAQLRDGLTVAGVATWYSGTRGYAGIPHVAMPGARYLAQGRSAPRAQVCAGDRCTVVRVVDACACFAGTRQARVVDLSATALLRLGLDRWRGVYQVRVTLLAP